METFVVRVFVPAGDEKLELTGVVEHSSTGRSEQFRGSADLLDIVRRQLETLDEHPEPRNREET